MKITLFLSLSLLVNVAATLDGIAILVLLNGGSPLEKLEYHCSAPERVFLEQVVNIGVETQNKRRLGNNNQRELADCRDLCSTIPTGYCFYRSERCRGWRRDLMFSGFSDVDGGDAWTPGGFTVLGGFDFDGDGDDTGRAVGLGSKKIKDKWGLGAVLDNLGLGDSQLFGQLHGLDFTDELSNFEKEDSTPIVPDEVADIPITVVPDEVADIPITENCQSEIQKTKDLMSKVLSEDLSVACMNLLEKLITFECVTL